MSALGQLIWNGLKAIGTNAWNGFKNINWLDLGKNIIIGIANGLYGIVSRLWEAIRNIASNIWKSFTNTDWSGIGSNIISGICGGLNNFGHYIWDTLKGWAQNAWENAKAFFGIGSPSKLMRDTIGKWIPLGMAEGIEDEGDSVVKAMNDIAEDATTAIDTEFGYNATAAAIGSGTSRSDSITINVYPSAGMDERALADMVQQRLALLQRQRQSAWGMA